MILTKRIDSHRWWQKIHTIKNMCVQKRKFGKKLFSIGGLMGVHISRIVKWGYHFKKNFKWKKRNTNNQNSHSYNVFVRENLLLLFFLFAYFCFVSLFLLPLRFLSFKFFSKKIIKQKIVLLTSFYYTTDRAISFDHYIFFWLLYFIWSSRLWFCCILYQWQRL